MTNPWNNIIVVVVVIRRRGGAVATLIVSARVVDAFQEGIAGQSEPGLIYFVWWLFVIIQQTTIMKNE